MELSRPSSDEGGDEKSFSEVVSLGSLCVTASWLRARAMRVAAFPFDWIHSSPAMVRHCLRDDFKTLLDRSQYFAAGREGIGHTTYTSMLLGRGKKVVWRHHDPLHLQRDYELLRRCVLRLRSCLRRRGARRLFVLAYVVRSKTALLATRSDHGSSEAGGKASSWMLGSDKEVRGLFEDLVAHGARHFQLDVVRLCEGKASEAALGTDPRALLRLALSSNMGEERLDIHELHMIGGHTGLKFKDKRDEDAFGALLLGAGSSTRRFVLKPSLYLRFTRPFDSVRHSESQCDADSRLQPPPALFTGYRDGCSQLVVSEEAEEFASSSPLPLSSLGTGTGAPSSPQQVAEGTMSSLRMLPTVAASPSLVVGQSVPWRRVRGKQSYKNAADSKFSPGSLGHTLCPDLQGRRVMVIGDGWGSGEGSFEAVVTEADNFTYTVIVVGSGGAYEETHVLKAYCTLVADVKACAAASAPKRPGPKPCGLGASARKKTRRAALPHTST